MAQYPQSVAQRIIFKVYLSSDHVTDATGKIIAVVISKNGGAFGNPSVGATNAAEIGNGFYYFDASTTDMGTKGPLVIRGTGALCDNSEYVHQVVSANNAGLAALPDVAAEASGGLYTRGSGAGQIAQSTVGTINALVADKTGFALTSGERDSTAAALLDLTDGAESGKTLRQSLRLFLAVLVGKMSGAGTDTLVFRDTNDTVDRVTASVESSGRTVIVLNTT